MARKPRVEFAGATYHVMCRGNRQEAIFRDENDHERFLDTLGEVSERNGWLIHAFVLMGNHYHLLLETPEPNLVDGMRWFQSTYTQRKKGSVRLIRYFRLKPCSFSVSLHPWQENQESNSKGPPIM